MLENKEPSLGIQKASFWHLYLSQIEQKMTKKCCLVTQLSEGITGEAEKQRLSCAATQRQNVTKKQ